MTLGLIYALLAPLVLVVSVISFSLIYLCFRYTLLYTAYIPVDTRGVVYFEAVFSLF